VCARAVRMIFEHEILEHKHEYANQSVAIMAIAPKIGCGRDTLRRRVKQSDIDNGRKDGQTSEDRAQIKAMEREIRELRQANEILRKASAYFAPLSSFASERLPGSGTDLARPLKR
jgi:transposase